MALRAFTPAALEAVARRLLSEPPGGLYSLGGTDRRPVTVRRLEVPDPNDLVGIVADPSWAGIALVLEGRSSELAETEHGRGDPVSVNISFVVDREGLSVLAIEHDDATVTISAGRRPVSGFIADLANRVLGLSCLPEDQPSSLLILSEWVQSLLDAVADPLTSPLIETWADIVALHPVLAEAEPAAWVPGPDELAELTIDVGRRWPWSRLHRAAASGTIAIDGLSPAEAGWMDDAFFARWMLGVHRPVTELLDDLSLFLDGALLAGVSGTVEAVGWLGFAESKRSSFTSGDE